MKLQRLMSLVRKAVDEYQLIEEGDRIAVGISGGKDSLALLYALSGLRRYYPKHFELEAVTVSLGFENFNQMCIRDSNPIIHFFHSFDSDFDGNRRK